MDYSWHDLVGNFGVMLILISYLLLQLQRLNVTDYAYSIANSVGAACILVSLSIDFNLSAFVVEAAWLLISLYGLLRCQWHDGGRRTARGDPP